MTKDRILGIVSVAFSILLAALTYFTVDPKIRMAGDPGSQIFPYGTALIFALAGICLVARKPVDEERVFLTGAQWKRLFSLFLAFCGYVLLIWLLGFLLATMVMLFVVSTMFAKGKGIPTVQRVIYSVVMTVLIYVIFRYGLKVLLPSGKLNLF